MEQDTFLTRILTYFTLLLLSRLVEASGLSVFQSFSAWHLLNCSRKPCRNNPYKWQLLLLD